MQLKGQTLVVLVDTFLQLFELSLALLDGAATESVHLGGLNTEIRKDGQGQSGIDGGCHEGSFGVGATRARR